MIDFPIRREILVTPAVFHFLLRLLSFIRSNLINLNVYMASRAQLF